MPSDRQSAWEPLLVKLVPGEAEPFFATCAREGLQPVDEIERQLADLASVRHPATESSAHRSAFLDEAAATPGGLACFGTWVAFPWDRRVVHLLDGADYFDVITNRNQLKIRRDEQLRLQRARVGVVGLSVGGEAAVTIAQEQLCGELRVADFDALDLSNLNRLGAGCDELGLNKAVIVARRIARINPYLRVRVYPGGVTAENLDDFLDGLDLLVEECDGLQLKYDIRTQARTRGLNVIFAADERGFLSVEPYALEPDLLPFHGLAATRPKARAEYESSSDFLRALTIWLGGWHAISARSRESLERVGAGVLGYPQLASEARYAAGQLGHVARRLLLGERVCAYVGCIDLDEFVVSRETVAPGSREEPASETGPSGVC
jgi:molybdopterin/thiamine biosynthesis adenylyltransferase